MGEDKPNVVVTGISGDLGRRLLPELSAYRVTGIDLNPPSTNQLLRFVRMDLGLEESCRELFVLLRELRPVALIHLAFVMDPRVAGIADADRVWQINVGGAARVMEALTEANRDEEIIKKFIFLGCAAAYGANLAAPATEDLKLAAQTLPVAIHKMEADQAVQQRAPSARGCSVYVLRTAVFAGGSAANYLVEALRGTPRGSGKVATLLIKKRKRFPFVLPWGARYLNNRVQFVHPEDVSRLIAYILRKSEPEARRLTVLNVSGRGDALTLERCLEISRGKLLRFPGRWTMRKALQFLWNLEISGIPPDAEPYLSGEQIMNTDRLREFLGPYHDDVIRYTVSEALADSFAGTTQTHVDGSTVPQSTP
jgi:nucleoside-diphosphate-sugar epimerase